MTRSFTITAIYSIKVINGRFNEDGKQYFVTMNNKNNFPKLHNAMWPGLVGKGSPGAEPCIDLDTMLDLTAKAEV